MKKVTIITITLTVTVLLTSLVGAVQNTKDNIQKKNTQREALLLSLEN